MKKTHIVTIILAAAFTAAIGQDIPTPSEIRLVGNNQVINCLSDPISIGIELEPWRPGYSFLWSTGESTPFVTVKPNSSETYTVTITNEDFNLSVIKTFTVIVLNSPIVLENNIVNVDRFTCQGDPIEISITATGGHGTFRYDWDFGATEERPIVRPEGAQVYNVTVTDECASSATGSVEVMYEPHAPLIADDKSKVTYTCEGESVTLLADLRNVQGGVGYGYQYAFAGQQANTPLVIRPEDLKTEQIPVIITDACGGQRFVQKIILEQQVLELKKPGDLIACVNEPIDLIVSDDGYFYWDGSSMHPSYNITLRKSKSFELIYIDECGKETKTTRTVNIEQKNPEWNLHVEHYERALTSSVTLDHEGMDHSWYLNGDLVSKDKMLALENIESDVNEVTLKSTSLEGCEYTSTREVVFRDGVSIPSAISPNGDGLNEVFTVTFEDELSTFEINIFDRWGQLIYTSNDQYFRWQPSDVRSIGPIGNFAYNLRATTKGGKLIEKTGVLTTINAK